MSIRTKTLALALAGASAVATPACVPTSGYIVTSVERPPAPRTEYVRVRPGFVWVPGRWVIDERGRWRWQTGYYLRERPGYVWVPGRWVQRGRSYVWVEGRWARPGVVIRRHY